MKPTVRLSRTLIVGSLVLSMGGLIDLIFPSLLPQDLGDAWGSYTPEEWEWFMSEDAGWIPIAVVAVGGLVFLVLSIAAMIGLLMLKRWARPLALWITVLTALTSPLLGAILYSGWSLMLIQSAAVMWGAALAMAYFSELDTHFES